MSAPYECRAVPSHPGIRRMELKRTLPDGGTLIGCVCGILYTGSSGAALSVAGHSAPAFRLTVFCCHPCTVMPNDLLTSGSSGYTAVSVSGAGGGVLTVLLRPENAGNG